MLYPEAKERENRFKLALRMGLPIFALAVVTMSPLLGRYFETIPTAFIVAAFSVLGVAVYYLFYLIYQGFNERITDPITHMFTREYFTAVMQKELVSKNFVFLLFSVENLDDINKRYGFANGDKVLRDAAKRIADFLEERRMHRVPVSHFKGGDFVLAFEGTQTEYRALQELFCAKLQHYSVEEIEVEIVGSMIDSGRTKSVDKLIEWLYELLEESRKTQLESGSDVDPDTIEQLVTDALARGAFSYRVQAAYADGKAALFEMIVKLVTAEGKLIHQKRFVPVISRLGLLRRFDEIQFDAAVHYAAFLEPGERLALKVAPSSLRHPLFFEHVMATVFQNSTVKKRLVFIISEESYYHQSEAFNARLQAYRRAGIQIVLDQLGGVHTSLRYLQELDVDMVRFENALGKAIGEPKVRALLEGLQQTVGALGYRSWIRMIEDETACQHAKALGIDMIQGNYLSPITPIKEQQ